MVFDGVLVIVNSEILLLLCIIFSPIAAQGLGFGNSVYWITFDEEFDNKVNFYICRHSF